MQWELYLYGKRPTKKRWTGILIMARFCQKQMRTSVESLSTNHTNTHKWVKSSAQVDCLRANEAFFLSLSWLGKNMKILKIPATHLKKVKSWNCEMSTKCILSDRYGRDVRFHVSVQWQKTSVPTDVNWGGGAREPPTRATRGSNIQAEVEILWGPKFLNGSFSAVSTPIT